jgi:hypothetical protein
MVIGGRYSLTIDCVDITIGYWFLQTAAITQCAFTGIILADADRLLFNCTALHTHCNSIFQWTS